MNEHQTWQKRNDAYLSAALAWLRLRLEKQAQQLPTALSSETESSAGNSNRAPKPESPTPWHSFGRSALARLGEKPFRAVKQLPMPSNDTSVEARLRVTNAALAEASAGDPPPALLLLSRQLGLTDFERDILLLCLGIELDTRVAALCARAQDDAGRSYPTYALALVMFDDVAWEALSPERPLRYWRLLDVNQSGAQPLTNCALRVDERIVSYCKGLNYLDDRLAPFLDMLSPLSIEALPASQRVHAETIVYAVTSANAPCGPIILQGRDRRSKRQVAGAVAATLELRCYRMTADVLPTHLGELETLTRLWQRDCLLSPLALYVDAFDVERSTDGSGVSDRLARFVLRVGGLVIIDTRAGSATSFEDALTLEIEKPTPAEQRVLWKEALGEQAGNIPECLSGQFNLDREDIEAVVVSARASDTTARLDEVLWRQCLARTRPQLDRLAEKLDARADWNRLVLPEYENALLHQIADQVQLRARVYDDWGFRSRMNRGLGIGALFAGDSGTGKTMAAEVLANALRLDLYRIDLSAVVSKYIGETEKNLRRVFDAAEDGGALLFFDEADAIFGKRSEVKDSHDRYANIEINYLLQRMEAYRGLAILATNMKSALDTAFMRRLRFIVNFPFPGVAERRRMWENVFPAESETDVLDHDRLAAFTLTGGSIHNVALNAAFLAAHANSSIGMPLVLDAIRGEFRKLDRPFSEGNFRSVASVARKA